MALACLCNFTFCILDYLKSQHKGEVKEEEEGRREEEEGRERKLSKLNLPVFLK